MLDVLIYGLVNGAILALIASGFSLCYSVSRLPNFAHGALYILAGLTAWTILRPLNLSYPVAFICALVLTALLGLAIYEFLVIRIRGMEASEIIITFALAMAITELLRYFGYLGPRFTLPALASGRTEVLGVPVDYHRLTIIGVGVLLLVFIWLFTHNTKVGLALRAIAQDDQAAMMLGIDSDLTAALGLSFGSALAALAALTVLPIGAITVEMGYAALIFAIAVAIVGGLGSIMGSMAAALVLGYAMTAASKFIGTQYQMVVALAFIVLTLIIRPSGLLGKQKELEERV